MWKNMKWIGSFMILVLCLGLLGVGAMANGTPYLQEECVETVIFAECIELTGVVVSSGTCGTNLSWVVENGVLTISGNGAMTDCEWDAMPWVEYREAIQKVVVEEGVTRIGSNSFQGCLNLESVEFSTGLRTVGDTAFYGCTNLREIELPEGVLTLGAGVFTDCENLEKVIIPASMTTLSGVFTSCPKLRSAGPIGGGYNIEFGWTESIPENAFQFSAVTKVVLPDTLKEIGRMAFTDCASLAEIEIPAGVTTFGPAVFNGCSALKEIELPGGLTEIQYGTFGGCTSLESIVIPEGVTSMGSQVFYGCYNLGKVTIPKSLTEIGFDSFNGCDGLASVYYGGTKEQWDAIVLGEGNDMLSVATVYFSGDTTGDGENEDEDEDAIIWEVSADGVLTISGNGAMTDCEWDAMPWVEYREAIQKVVVEEGVTRIGSNSFQGCLNLESVEFPAGLRTVGDTAFYGCANLREIELPEGILTLGAGVFTDCENLEKVTIPASMTTLSGVFTSCPKLRSAGPIGGGYNIEFGWTESIPENAFQFSAVTKVVLPDTLKEIGRMAFTDCASLAEIEIPAGVTAFGPAVFNGCSALKEIELPGGLTEIQYGTFGGCTSLGSIVIPEGVTSMGSQVFYGCYNLEIVTIPKSLTAIGFDSFNGCDGLANVYYGGTKEQWDAIALGEGNDMLSVATVYFSGDTTGDGESEDSITWEVSADGVLTISGSGAMTDCEWDAMPWVEHRESIQKVVVEEGITRIGSNSFQGCFNLESVEFPTGLRTVGDTAFYGCTNLRELELPEGVLTLGAGVFTDCENLEKVTIPASMTTLSGVFVNCPKLQSAGPIGGGYNIEFGWTESIPENAFQFSAVTEVVLPATLKEIGRQAFADCFSLAEIEIPAGVTAFGPAVFNGCSALKAIELPGGLTEIQYGTFGGCTSLGSIVIPEGVTSMGSQVFYGCYNLEKVTIPKSLTAIGFDSFNGCDGLANVYYGGTKEQWDAIALGEGNDMLSVAELRFVGDMDGDGNVAPADIVILMKYVIESENTEVEQEVVDATGDGIADILDVIRLIRYLAGDNVTLN